MATANLTDMSILATDTVFGNRVLMSLVQYCDTTMFASGVSNAWETNSMISLEPLPSTRFAGSTPSLAASFCFK
jgi:hypothetical protein